MTPAELKAHKAAVARAWRKKNPERYAEINREGQRKWAKNHPEKRRAHQSVYDRKQAVAREIGHRRDLTWLMMHVLRSQANSTLILSGQRPTHENRLAMYEQWFGCATRNGNPFQVSTNKAYKNARLRKWRAENPDRLRVYNERYSKKKNSDADGGNNG